MKNTPRIKAEALAWLAFGKRLPIVCTEVGNWHADVFGVGKNFSAEVEVKVSKSDLRAEFKNKASKHEFYQNHQGRTFQVPNYLYFMVPKELEEAALEIVPVANPKAGICVCDLSEDRHALVGQSTAVVKYASRLHGDKPPPAIIRQALMRMRSELCGLWDTNNRLQDLYSYEFDRFRKATVAAAFRNAGALDIEDPKKELVRRAHDLAVAVEGVGPWQELSDEQQQKWLTAAEKYRNISEDAVQEWIYESSYL